MLSGLCDIYEVFGYSMVILQTVNMLPHDKFDRFKSSVIDKFNLIVTSLDRSTCTSTHASEEIKTSNTYRGIPMAQSHSEESNT